MNPIITQMIAAHVAITPNDKKNVIKEVLQEVILSGLSRAGFFKTAAFYGGTALRIFHGLDRFSEDLDFSLKVEDSSFNLEQYLPLLEKEIRSYGFNFSIETKQKTHDSNIQSAFLKVNTKEHILKIFPNADVASSISANELLKIKFEIDTNPPSYAGFEIKFHLLPIPYEVTLYDLPSLFAGKIHALLCRGWINRVKGRDLYDYVFYLTKGISVNIEHLSARLAQSNQIPAGKVISIDELKIMLRNRFMKIDYEQAKSDVLSYIKDPRPLDVWGSEFFIQITDMLK